MAYNYLNYILDYFYGLPIWLGIVIGCAFCFFIIQMVYYWGFFTNIFRFKRKCRKNKVSFLESFPPVSVIICAKNEEVNLNDKLPKVLEQDYPDYEVIVVNDSSSDESEEVLAIMKTRYERLHTTFVPENAKFIDSKKFALTLGIKAAKNEILIFTDADCEPRTDKWLKNIVRNFTEDTQIVLGYGGYKHKKSLLNYIIVFDTLFIAIQYLNYSLSGKTYMGVGRNMAYRKSMFIKSKGFTAHLNLQSGDDDLFINETATKTNTRIEISPDSITISEPKDTFSMWKRQKERHLSTSGHYRFGSKALIGAEVLSRGLFYASLIALIISFDLVASYIAAGMFLIRYITQYIIINLTAKQLGERKYYIGILALDILLPLINLNIQIKSLFRGKEKYKWK
ncbi:MAG: Poly-beta-1,6-N-acetyl-D-glucosamine synthase [Bacteroidetes bacterium ADurb.Bin302]|nr:MAG: Poly-beta-1,6-N-acetyl-D-glucosamine synthase [Bacteroidetes bacterium ADurb.Bin302]